MSIGYIFSDYETFSKILDCVGDKEMATILLKSVNGVMKSYKDIMANSLTTHNEKRQCSSPVKCDYHRDIEKKRALISIVV